MAGGKAKPIEGSIDDRLEQALVPDWEQPYKVPENWCWTRLGCIAEVVGGGTPASGVKEYYDNGDIPWISPADLSGYSDVYISRGNKNITALGLKESSARLMPANTVCLSSRAPIGYVAIASNPLCTNQGFKSFLPSPVYLPKYLYWYLKASKELLESYASGTTFMEVSGGKVAQVEIPLPPLAEQQRIVDRIESLFTKLDEAKEKLQEVVDGVETRKAAILHKAFAGELTAQWREEHGVGLESWERKSINNVCSSLQYGTSKKSQKSGKIIVVRMGNLQHGKIVWDDLAYSSDESEMQKYLLVPGDVLFNRTNSPELVGKTSIYRGEVPAIFAGYLIRLITKKDIIDGEYLNYVLNSIDAKEYCNQVKTDGVNQSNINAKKIGAYTFLLPSLPEQEVMVSLLNNLLGLCQDAKDKTEPFLGEIELIKKSILARAFRGELGTNDPSEESAIELLKSILDNSTGKEIQPPRRKAVSIPSEILQELSNELQKDIVRIFFKKDVKTLTIEEIMSVSSKKFDVLESLRVLEQKGLIKRQGNGNYILMR